MRFLAILRGPIGITCMVAFVSMLVWKPKVVAAAPLVLIGIFSPLAVFNLIRIGLLLVGLTHLDQHRGGRTLPAAQPGPEGQARVIWMIFDETDQRLAFEKRPATVHLPEFDRLREESIFATNAYPPGDSTLLSMPALILGRPFSAASPSSASDLALSVPNTNLTNSWQEQPSVFDGARKLGVNTALVGWYHPYDRVLQRGLNYCAWFPIPNFEPARAATLGGSLTRELGAMTGGFYIRYLYVGLCQESFKEAVSVIANRSYGLVLLHLPLPHEPGIYQPDKDRFTAWGMPRTTGYFNNLILADRWLGKLRRSLETSTPPTNTWLIVSSDHSWRESRLYDQIRDLRVPFIIRPPGAPKAQTYSSHLNTVVTHDLILAILRNEIQSRQDTLAWLDQHRSVLPAPAESQGDL